MEEFVEICLSQEPIFPPQKADGDYACRKIKLTLKNLSEQYVFYQTKCNNPSAYKVRHPIGFIEPKKEMIVIAKLIPGELCGPTDQFLLITALSDNADLNVNSIEKLKTSDLLNLYRLQCQSATQKDSTADEKLEIERIVIEKEEFLKRMPNSKVELQNSLLADESLDDSTCTISTEPEEIVDDPLPSIGQGFDREEIIDDTQFASGDNYVPETRLVPNLDIPEPNDIPDAAEQDDFEVVLRNDLLNQEQFQECFLKKHIDVEPRCELYFSEKTKNASILMTNASPYRLAYKLTTNNRYAYLVVSPKGVLEPNEMYEIQMRLLHEKCGQKDQFILTIAKIESGMSADDVFNDLNSLYLNVCFVYWCVWDKHETLASTIKDLIQQTDNERTICCLKRDIETLTSKNLQKAKKIIGLCIFLLLLLFVGVIVIHVFMDPFWKEKPKPKKGWWSYS